MLVHITVLLAMATNALGYLGEWLPARDVTRAPTELADLEARVLRTAFVAREGAIDTPVCRHVAAVAWALMRPLMPAFATRVQDLHLHSLPLRGVSAAVHAMMWPALRAAAQHDMDARAGLPAAGRPRADRVDEARRHIEAFTRAHPSSLSNDAQAVSQRLTIACDSSIVRTGTAPAWCEALYVEIHSNSLPSFAHVLAEARAANGCPAPLRWCAPPPPLMHPDAARACARVAGVCMLARADDPEWLAVRDALGDARVMPAECGGPQGACTRVDYITPAMYIPLV